MTRVRLEAARVLLNVEGGHTTLAADVERARAALDSARDRGLLLELTSGTLRWRNLLDAAIARAAGRQVTEIDAPVLAVLRTGAYQLLRLERIPAHAVVHESVETVRALGARHAAGFVNAVLRALSSGAPLDGLPSRPAADASRKDHLAFLETTMSHPRWLAARWLDRVGAEAAERWCQFNNTPPSPTVRPIDGDVARLQKALSDAAVEAAPARYLTGALRLPPGALGTLPAALRDALVIQDEGSQLVALAAGASPVERVLDACAAPGGKTSILLDSVGPTGTVIAADRRLRRVDLLRRTLARHGRSTPVLCLDATRPLPFAAAFDLVLVDAPCSGVGTLSRDPDLKWRRTTEQVIDYAAAQHAMLLAAADAVRPDGRLVYATCSSEPEENHEVVERFLADRPAFALVPVRFPPQVTDGGSLLDERGCLATNPASHGLDGYFAAVLARRQPA